MVKLLHVLSHYDDFCTILKSGHEFVIISIKSMAKRSAFYCSSKSSLSSFECKTNAIEIT